MPQAFDFLGACQTAMQQDCSKVNPGYGRLIACFYAHEDKLSEPCDELLMGPLDQVDWPMADMRESIEVCIPDIRSTCADAPLAGAGKRTCLMAKRDQVSPECRKAIIKIEQRPAN